jgi:hypothetical protein
VRQVAGTLTSTGRLFARTTIPVLLQYGQRDSPLETVCGMYAGGAETTPSTTRCGRQEY